MALVTVNTSIKIGFDQRYFTSGNTSTINGTTVGLAMPFVAQFTGSITRVVMSATVATNYTNLQVGIMSSNAAGNLPNDVYIQTPNIQSGSSSSTPTNYIINLTNAVSVVKGTVYWLVFKPNASFTGNLSIYYNHYISTISYNGYWKVATRIASSWIQGATVGSNVMYGDSSRWYSVDDPVVPDSPTVISPVVGQEYGFAFTLDANHPAVKIKAISFANSLSNNSTTGNPGMTFICKIYNAAGTLLYTFDTQDTDRLNTTAGNGNAWFYNSTGSDIWFEPNTKYYILQAFTGTFTNTPQYSTYTYDNTLNKALGAYNANYATRSSGGVSTETTTQFMNFHFDVDAIRFDNAGGGAGGYVNASPMFSGGFSG